MSKYERLFTPIRIGTHEYKNRIVASPIYSTSFLSLAEAPELGFELEEAMRARALGGCAQVTLGETPVNFTGASREPFPPIDYANYEDPMMKQLSRITSFVKEQGAKCLIELSHCGESVEDIPGVEYGLGPMGYTRDDGMQIYAMDEDSMSGVINDFIVAAEFMRHAGVDGAVIHAGHGWLLHQFLSSRTNQRTDRYGGSLENRARFPLKLFKALRNALGKEFIIEMRVSGDECMENGMGIDETVEFCKLVEPYIDSIHMSVGVYRNPILSGEFSSLFQKHGLNADYAAAVKAEVSIPVIVVGGINSPELAEELLAQSKCDLVALGRQLTADPNFANKAELEMGWDISPCLRCFKCFPGPLEGVSLSDLPFIFGCTVNPAEFFYDVEFLNKKPEGPRKVLVVGGGVGGMQAAITAHDRGHDVTLVEKADKLGGLLFFTDTDNYKEDLRAFKDVLIRRIEERGIKVLLNTEFTAEAVSEFKADALIVAIGSSPIVPPIKGIENAVHALDVYRGKVELGKKIIIIGGGLVGCETGLHLAKEGKEVTVIEMGEIVAPDSYPMHRIGLVNELDQLVTTKTKTKCIEILPTAVKVVDEFGNELLLEADSIVFALGMKANSAEKDALLSEPKNSEVYEIGDCVRAAKVYEAVREGFTAAMSIY